MTTIRTAAEILGRETACAMVANAIATSNRPLTRADILKLLHSYGLAK